MAECTEDKPFDFYQYWVNTDDLDVERFLRLYTFLPVEEIEVVRGLEGQELNVCKTVLAYEVTALTHGQDQAIAVFEAASQIFGQRALPSELLPSSLIPRETRKKVTAIPTTEMTTQRLEAGIPAFQLFAEIGLCLSKGAARRLIEQGGAYVNEERIRDFDALISGNHLTAEGILLKAGKKRVHRIRVQD